MIAGVSTRLEQGLRLLARAAATVLMLLVFHSRARRVNETGLSDGAVFLVAGRFSAVAITAWAAAILPSFVGDSSWAECAPLRQYVNFGIRTATPTSSQRRSTLAVAKLGGCATYYPWHPCPTRAVAGGPA